MEYYTWAANYCEPPRYAGFADPQLRHRLKHIIIYCVRSKEYHPLWCDTSSANEVCKMHASGNLRANVLWLLIAIFVFLLSFPDETDIIWLDAPERKYFGVLVLYTYYTVEAYIRYIYITWHVSDAWTRNEFVNADIRKNISNFLYYTFPFDFFSSSRAHVYMYIWRSNCHCSIGL